MWPQEILTRPLLQRVESNESAPDCEERKVSISPALPANAQPAEVVQPGQRPLYHPSRLAQTTAMGAADLRQQRANAACSQPAPVIVAAVPAISLNDLGAVPGTAWLALHRGNPNRGFTSHRVSSSANASLTNTPSWSVMICFGGPWPRNAFSIAHSPPNQRWAPPVGRRPSLPGRSDQSRPAPKWARFPSAAPACALHSTRGLDSGRRSPWGSWRPSEPSPRPAWSWAWIGASSDEASG
jgi:hypothetical protein